MKFISVNPHTTLKSINVTLLSIIALIGLYIIFCPVPVLENWTVTMPGTVFTEGQTLNVESKYNKVRDVSGTARRYLNCPDSRGVIVRYPVSEAVADNTPGVKRGTGVPVTLPTNIPNLPARCTFSISIEYDINFLKKTNVSNETGKFLLNPAPEVVK